MYRILVSKKCHRYSTCKFIEIFVVIPPANEVAGVYSDPYVRPFVRSNVRPSVPPNL